MGKVDIQIDGDAEAFLTQRGLRGADVPVLQTAEDWGILPERGVTAAGRTGLVVDIPVRLMQPQMFTPGKVHVMALITLNSWMQVAHVLRAAFRDEVEQLGFAAVDPHTEALLRQGFVDRMLDAGVVTGRQQAEIIAALFFEHLADPRGR